MTSLVHYFDGEQSHPAEVAGWWDGSTIHPVELAGWWDGTSVRDIADTEPPPTADPVYPTPARVELFTDASRIASSTGVTFTPTPVTRQSSPLFGGPGETWDREKSFVSVTKRDGLYHAHYYGLDDAAVANYACYAYSTDGVTFTKPDLGTFTRDGSTANNILFAGISTGASYDEFLGKWVISAEPNLHVLLSDAPSGPFVEVANISDAVVGGVEGKEVVRRPDGRWVGYYSHGHSIQRRTLGAFFSDTIDPAGTWATVGDLPVFTSTSQDHQFYGIGVHPVGDVLIGFVMIYNKTDESMWLDLYSSRDGFDWALVKADWMPLGTPGGWDDHMLINGSTLVDNGDLWEFYYTGSPEGHATFPRDMRVGKATLRLGGLVEVVGPGTVTTTTLNAQAGDALTVNADGTGGVITVDVLDMDGNPIPGYTATINTDSAARPLPVPARDIALRFTLATGAKLYGYTLA